MGVFRDRDRLLPDFPIEDYWDSLPYRDFELKTLWSIFKPALEDPKNSFLRVVQAVGPAGSGKTCTLRLFGRMVEEEYVNVKHVYLNLRVEGGRKTVLYRNIARRIEPKLVSVSLSAEETLLAIVSLLQSSDRRVILTVDEVDYYVKHFKDEGVVYDLTRLNELSPGRPCGFIGVVLLARSRDFHRLLDEAELSKLGRLQLTFKPYNVQQVRDILDRRAEEALNPGTYSEDVLSFIADLTASPPVNGDMRYALDLLLYAGTLAELEGSQAVKAEHVRKIHGSLHPRLTSEEVMSLPEEEKLVLLALSRVLTVKKTAYATFREVYEEVQLLCEEQGRKPIAEVDEYLQDLSDRGIVDIRGLTRIGLSGLSAEDLEKFLTDIVQKLKGGVSEWLKTRLRKDWEAR
ncbi:MAG: AAA family ATPase [Candidatus Bathyarchaeia archaeon]